MGKSQIFFTQFQPVPAIYPFTLKTLILLPRFSEGLSLITNTYGISVTYIGLLEKIKIHISFGKSPKNSLGRIGCISHKKFTDIYSSVLD